MKNDTWQMRALKATGYNTTKLGMIMMAVVGMPVHHPPMISMRRGAVIDEDGWVLADVMLPGQNRFRATVLGSLRDIVDNFRRVADREKFSDADRVALFRELHKWAATDLRARGKVEIVN
jgi:hypothetical protein